MRYYQVLISCETRLQGLNLLEHLMAKQLVLGGPVFSGPARFLWKGDSSALPGMRNVGLATVQRALEVVEHDYCFIVTYTREDLKQQLVEVAEGASVEEVCMISCIPMEPNAALERLLEDTFARRENAAPPQHTEAIAALTFVPLTDVPTRTKRS
jgi:hypothetical protein